MDVNMHSYTERKNDKFDIEFNVRERKDPRSILSEPYVVISLKKGVDQEFTLFTDPEQAKYLSEVLSRETTTEEFNDALNKQASGKKDEELKLVKE